MCVKEPATRNEEGGLTTQTDGVSEHLSSCRLQCLPGVQGIMLQLQRRCLVTSASSMIGHVCQEMRSLHLITETDILYTDTFRDSE